MAIHYRGVLKFFVNPVCFPYTSLTHTMDGDALDTLNINQDATFQPVSNMHGTDPSIIFELAVIVGATLALEGVNIGVSSHPRCARGRDALLNWCAYYRQCDAGRAMAEVIKEYSTPYSAVVLARMMQQTGAIPTLRTILRVVAEDIRELVECPEQVLGGSTAGGKVDTARTVLYNKGRELGSAYRANAMRVEDIISPVLNLFSPLITVVGYNSDPGAPPLAAPLLPGKRCLAHTMAQATMPLPETLPSRVTAPSPATKMPLVRLYTPTRTTILPIVPLEEQAWALSTSHIAVAAWGFDDAGDHQGAARYRDYLTTLMRQAAPRNDNERQLVQLVYQTCLPVPNSRLAIPSCASVLQVGKRVDVPLVPLPIGGEEYMERRRIMGIIEATSHGGEEGGAGSTTVGMDLFVGGGVTTVAAPSTFILPEMGDGEGLTSSRGLPRISWRGKEQVLDAMVRWRMTSGGDLFLVLERAKQPMVVSG